MHIWVITRVFEWMLDARCRANLNVRMLSPFCCGPIATVYFANSWRVGAMKTVMHEKENKKNYLSSTIRINFWILELEGQINQVLKYKEYVNLCRLFSLHYHFIRVSSFSFNQSRTDWNFLFKVISLIELCLCSGDECNTAALSGKFFQSSIDKVVLSFEGYNY